MKADMANLIAEAVANPVKGEYVCQYCSKAFIRESTLLVHNCEPKRRTAQRSEVGVSLGLQAWIRFYELTQGSAKTKTYSDFMSSPFYVAFVKFGRYCYHIRAVNSDKFIDYVIKNNIKIDHWCRESVYSTYLAEMLKIEATEDALTRAINYMQEWAEESGNSFNDYFRKITTNRLVLMISNGRISPWVIYNCDSALAILAEFNEEQITSVWPIIDSDFWTKKLRHYPADTELAKHVLREAGL